MNTTASEPSRTAVPVTARPADEERVLLAHGGGGELMNRLIREHLVPALDNEPLARLTDGAVLDVPDGRLVFTTDSYVVTPLEFAGGDIGRLAVCGTVNDLAVMGATPVALSLGLILEEGLTIRRLRRVIRSVAAAAHEAGVTIVTGDTKVVERRGGEPVATAIGGAQADDAGDALYINTAGVGVLRSDARLDLSRCQAGDAILINGRVAEHGLTIMSLRSGIGFNSDLRSDAAPLNGLISSVLVGGADVRFMRDATRGGLAAVLADICDGTNLTVEVDEKAIPLSATARHAAEILGLDPLNVANEGKVVMVVASADAERALQSMRSHPHGRHAACIGSLTDAQPALVELVTRAGGRRVVQRPYGEELPRIC
jgi:hydrogenase expression/formation protein HypE